MDLRWKLEDALKAEFAEGLEKGIEQGIEKTATTINMLHKGETAEKIQEITGLSLERINEIAKAINK